jgi:hypothetical protein
MRRFTRVLAVGLSAIVASIAIPAAAHAAPQPAQQFQNYNSKFCMGVSGGNVTDGTAIITWDCNGNTDQGWELDPGTGNQSGFLFRNATNPNQCLSVGAKSTSAGAHLVIWHCKAANDNQDQLWQVITIPRAPLALREIFNSNSGLGIFASNSGRGAQVIQSTIPDATNSQLFVWGPCSFTAGVAQGCPGV